MYSIFGLKLFSLFLHYIEELLRNGQSMEFFLEGGRSRSGKSLSPKAGLLSVIKETLCSGTERLLLYFILVSLLMVSLYNVMYFHMKTTVLEGFESSLHVQCTFIILIENFEVFCKLCFLTYNLPFS